MQGTYIITSIRRYRDDVSSCIFNKRYLNNLSYINRFSEKIKLRQSKTIQDYNSKFAENIRRNKLTNKADDSVSKIDEISWDLAQKKRAIPILYQYIQCVYMYKSVFEISKTRPRSINENKQIWLTSVQW